MNRPLFWHQGLFLQPQHFQLADLHTRSLLEPLHTYLCPCFWGMGSIDIVETALDNFSFEIVSGEFLFPDMTHCVFPGNSVLEFRSFESAWTDGGKTFMVYLGIKKWNDRGENVSVVNDYNRLGPISTRFVSLVDSEEVRDLHHRGPAADIKQMSYLLKIFWETEIDQAGDYQLLPVARLERSKENILLSSGYVPPVLTMTGSVILQGISREIMDQLSARSRQLEAAKRERGVHTAEFGSRDMVFMLALRSLNRYVPLLYHINAEGRMHPWHMYGILRQIIGEMSSFTDEISSNGELKNGEKLLPDYDHRRLWHCFYSVQELMTRLLDTITAGPEYIITLHWDGTYFSAELPAQLFNERNRYFLVLESETDEQALISAMDTIAKISSRVVIPTLMLQALPGVKVSHLASPPQNLPRRTGAVYFSIDHHSPHWQNIQSSNAMAILWDTAPDDLNIDLMVVQRD